MKRKLSNIILTIVFLVGLSLLLYPFVSDYINSRNQSQAIATYMESVAEIDNEKYEAMMQEAHEYNQRLVHDPNRWSMTDAEKEEYLGLLNINQDGTFGYIEIPAIECSLPVYHGVEEEVLQVAIGHIEGTSLPVGGSSTHSVLSGHRGLPSAKLFTNLDLVQVGDIFILNILDTEFTYEVDQIRIVEPQDVSDLEIEEGKDLCTLVTCTPYGVNSHRLLVRGHRVDNTLNETVRVAADAFEIDSLTVAVVLAIPVLLLLFVVSLIRNRKR